MCKFRKAQTDEVPEIFKLLETVPHDCGISTNAKVTDKDLTYLNKYYFNRKGWPEILVNWDGKIIGSW